MKSLFKSKPRSPAELVRQTRDHLLYIDLHQGNKARDSKREEKLVEVSKLIREIKLVLYGVDDADPVPDACAQMTQEIFKDNTFRMLIDLVPKLNLEARRDVTHIVANLQRQKVNSRLIASDYLEANKDIVDHLVKGYEEMDLALHYGSMLKELIRHQCIAKYILESETVKMFFDYLQLPSFDIAANASSVFKELLTRHKSTVADFLGKNYDWFFADYNSKLLSSDVYVIKLQATKLLADILLERSNSAVMTRYVNSKDNLRISMNLLKEPNKNIPMDAFHVFKLFVANQNKPPEIVSVLVHNRNKLLQLLCDFKSEKVNEQFEADKERVIQEIIALEPRD